MSGEKILVVEDENIVALGIKKMLKRMGFRVPSIAASGEEAIKKAEITFPDLVLMDIMLKGKIDGIEAAEKIYGTMDIPVVYLTAYSDDKILERSKKTKPYGYLIKPFEENSLQNTIKVALGNYRKEKEKKE
ncbi:response regulator [Methanohalophilus halophilus]|uniref:CheY chemotaxis protein or a CheY-like REC (Receiver) domain n=1 Tax=Methanohalophilus halophilus TaxID=2177 RepID=A0A1L3PZY0_9EURY|nr:response regulator [Methanohalophilus halophilus]APH38187.1 two-component system response regulator [Methanohalophilus halophilus]RNI10946.1 response regulator [Methanohalophilus halophilus]SDV99342.1 CheY chemotaxis protein or a CheY-like REC (receiver) domain [Methanohalophilus halophilus]